MSGGAVIILILVILIGIPGVIIGVYLFKSFIRESWFQNLLTGIIDCIIAIGLIPCLMGLFLMWDYSHAEAKYLEFQPVTVQGNLVDVEYEQTKGGNYFRFIMEDGHSYVLQDIYFVVDFDVERWADLRIDREILLDVKPYGRIEGLMKSPIFNKYGSYDGQIYGIRSTSGKIILDQEKVRKAYYDWSQNKGNVSSGIWIGIAIIIPGVLVRCIWRKVCRKFS